MVALTVLISLRTTVDAVDVSLTHRFFNVSNSHLWVGGVGEFGRVGYKLFAPVFIDH
jgi:hypothetical protein